MKTLLILVVVLVSIGFVSAQQNSYGCNMYGMMSGSYGFGGMAFGWIFGFLVTVVLILLIFWLIKQIQKK